MSEKVEFLGDVGQAVIGDVKEAPRLSNVVNLSLNEVKKEVQLITDYQRKRIKLLVKEWAAICGDKEIEIYKVFIADFGIRYFRELPMEHYFTVKETLERWIAAGTVKPIDTLPTVAAEYAKPQNQARAYCASCAEKDASFARAQRTNFAQWILIAILVVACGWLVYKMQASHDESQQPENKCYFEGKAYSPGSTVRNVTGILQECAAERLDSPSRWITVRRPK